MYHMEATAAFLADAAQVLNGKLYVHGGGWDTIFAGSMPIAHPTMALVLIFRVEYSEALKDIPIQIQLLDEDENPAGIHVHQKLNVGHPAGSKPGSPLFVPQALTFNMLTLQKLGDYRFRIAAGEDELASVPFRVAPAPGTSS
jgi:uncharacterized protein DUF6941